jgi:type VII secretion protein EccE
VVAELAVVLVLAALDQSPVVVAAAGLAAAGLVAVGWLRIGRRWLYQWLGIAIRYAGRRRTLPADAPAAELLALVAPGTHIVPAELGGDAAAVLVDQQGLTAILDLGDPNAIVAEAGYSLPSPANLLPPATSDTPPVRVQLVVNGVSAPAPRAGGGTAATSYRQLANGRLLGQDRALLAVRVLRADGWEEDDLHRALSSLIRKLRRRLGEIPSRPLGEAAVLGVLGDLAHRDGAREARESWSALRLGGLFQAAFRLRRWPDLQTETARRLVPRLLALPAAAATVSVAVGPRNAARPEEAAGDLVIRLAAEDTTSLASSARALRDLLAAERATAQRLDGEQLDGLAATLPLGGVEAPVLTKTAANVRPAPAGLGGLELAVGHAGLMIGANRHGAPVLARLFRPEPTRALLVGGLPAAQVLVLRAMALGAGLAIQTARPQAWEPFLRAVAGPGQPIPVLPPGRAVSAPQATALAPLLIVVDAGAVPAEEPPIVGWQANLAVRGEVSPGDVDALSRADLVVLQPLRPDEVALAGAALGLGENAEWLARIRHDMVGVVHRRSVRWALLSATAVEAGLVGRLERG